MSVSELKTYKGRYIVFGVFVTVAVLFFVIPFFMTLFMFKAYFIPTGAMEDTLLIGDHIFMKRIICGSINRGDVVIFRPPHDEDKDYIKRCIAVGGNTFEIRNDKVYLNNKPLDEPYVKGATKPYDFGPRGPLIDGIVPNGKIVVLGDNRENSKDRRHFGYLEEKAVKGKAVLIYWNTKKIAESGFSHMGFIK